jgi:hypothetical protein
VEPIKQTISSILQELRQKKEKASFRDPADILKKGLAKKELSHVEFSSFAKGILRLKVDSSTWLYYLNLRKDALITRFSEDLPGIKDIKFSIGVSGQKIKKHCNSKK